MVLAYLDAPITTQFASSSADHFLVDRSPGGLQTEGIFFDDTALVRPGTTAAAFRFCGLESREMSGSKHPLFSVSEKELCLRRIIKKLNQNPWNVVRLIR